MSMLKNSSAYASNDGFSWVTYVSFSNIYLWLCLLGETLIWQNFLVTSLFAASNKPLFTLYLLVVLIGFTLIRRHLVKPS